MKGILGTKVGMTQVWKNDRAVPVTVILAGPCPVVQRRTPDKDGYAAVQLGFRPQKAQRVNKPLKGHFAKAGVEPALVYQAIRGGLAGSTVLDAKAPLVMDRKFEPGFRIKLHVKDLANVMATANELHVPLPLTAGVMEVMQAMLADGCGEDDHGSIIRYFEKLAHVEVRR